MAIKIHCKGKHRTYVSLAAANADNVWRWAVRCTRGEDGLYHAFEREDDYREFKKVSPTNYR